MTYKVLNCNKGTTRQWLSPKGENITFQNYTLELQDEHGTSIAAEYSCKAGSPDPSGEVSGHIETTQYGNKFKMDRPAFAPKSFGNKPREIALQCAVQFNLKKADSVPQNVLDAAETFLAWLEQKPVIKPVDDKINLNEMDF